MVVSPRAELPLRCCLFLVDAFVRIMLLNLAQDRASSAGGTSRVLKQDGADARDDDGIILTDGNVFQVCCARLT